MSSEQEHLSVKKTLDQLATPQLLVDETRMNRNISRLRRRLAALDVGFRPHLKTTKSVEIARRLMLAPTGPATVSTLREAEQFADAGVTDILYAVGITPEKVQRALAIRHRGCDLAVILDSIEQASAVAQLVEATGAVLPILIEIDCDGHRSGVRPDDHAKLASIAAQLKGGAELRGVLTHAGGSYSARGDEELRAAAEQERAAVVLAAETLRGLGYACPTVSVGSTPTAHFAERLDGVTEVRAGVFAFFDLAQAGIGVCTVDDIALSVLTTVIGHQREKGWILVDAGWMAMSRDRATAKQAVDQGYGLVCDVACRPLGDLLMIEANQEHGILAARPGSSSAVPDLPVGSKLRILPNHACATGAQHSAYTVIGFDGTVGQNWSRFGGW